MTKEKDEFENENLSVPCKEQAYDHILSLTQKSKEHVCPMLAKVKTLFSEETKLRGS